MLNWMKNVLHYAWVVMIVDLVLVGSLTTWVGFQLKVMGNDVIVGRK